ncbi:DUF1462 family protein [Bacillaceae bacterium SIJ1]|uniref:DUF1462 family protein n=1 Tax=Litoribacterium kuwaitense TaxID=1398745 RepID=UPI0013EA77B3|nr:DUF1462 family protein [Litoribacterium kuwaitense]NGP46632.1 DUF1462 family protein [Litoribacterium kuwaitense]
MPQTATMVVIGKDTPCPSCVNAPSSKETFEWLNAALTRKFPHQPFASEYVDMDHVTEEYAAYEAYINAIVEEEYFYPLVLINGDVVADGLPRLKTVAQALIALGYKPVSQ